MCLLPARGWSTFWRCPPSGVSRFAGHLSAMNRGRPTAMATCPSWPDALRGLRAVGGDLQECPGGLVDLAGRHAPRAATGQTRRAVWDGVRPGWVDRTPI